MLRNSDEKYIKYKLLINRMKYYMKTNNFNHMFYIYVDELEPLIKYVEETYNIKTNQHIVDLVEAVS